MKHINDDTVNTLSMDIKELASKLDSVVWCKGWDSEYLIKQLNMIKSSIKTTIDSLNDLNTVR